ncbi:hypothetical protein [Butyrivibrio sp. INlla16]|uniref:hypothetical protein n=1 Tax=Butyrivibrio sp. INlla16 TaxID=1520807 RepID=UPI00087E564F|nr:hypothetical protein [Butyrivibrio sp. INlla16]SDB68385.1 hypothetical protein SAMN02910263_04171 [Butyrivibrio sp. INlla16]
MNWYKEQADTLQRILDRDRNDMEVYAIKDLMEKISLYKTLSKFSEEDKFRAFDSGMFNAILKGYAIKAMDSFSESGTDEEKEAAEILRAKIQGKLDSLLDLMPAKAAEQYYMDH